MISTVGLLSPGDMGHSLGHVLRHDGMRVITCLTGRSERSQALAAEAGIEDVASDEELVGQADVFLSVLPPDQALGLAERISAAVKETGAQLLYVDCNAVSPNSVRRVAEVITGAGARFVDAGIIGNPPRPDRPGPKIYASGHDAAELAELRSYGLDIRVMDGDVGQASGIKMCYAALTKGLTALGTELLVAAERMGLSAALHAELESSQNGILPWLTRQIPSMPPKAYRWVGEMLEIAATFEEVGLTPKIHQGAADMYRLVGHSELANETPENRTRGETLEDVVEALAKASGTPG